MVKSDEVHCRTLLTKFAGRASIHGSMVLMIFSTAQKAHSNLLVTLRYNLKLVRSSSKPLQVNLARQNAVLRRLSASYLVGRSNAHVLQSRSMKDHPLKCALQDGEYHSKQLNVEHVTLLRMLHSNRSHEAITSSGAEAYAASIQPAVYLRGHGLQPCNGRQYFLKHCWQLHAPPLASARAGVASDIKAQRGFRWPFWAGIIARAPPPPEHAAPPG